MYETFDVTERFMARFQKKLMTVLFINTVLILCSILLNIIFIYDPIVVYQSKIDPFLNDIRGVADEVHMTIQFINSTKPIIIALENLICQFSPKDCPRL